MVIYPKIHSEELAFRNETELFSEGESGFVGMGDIPVEGPASTAPG